MDTLLDILAYVGKEASLGSGLMRSRWFDTPSLSIYLRNTQYHVNGRLCSCIVIANVTVFDKGKGVFTSLVNSMIDAIHPSAEFLVIENVVNERFASHLNGRDFKGRKFTLCTDDVLPSYAMDLNAGN